MSFFVGTLVFVSGSIGFGRIKVLGRTLGSGLILFLLLPFLVVKDLQTKSSRILVEPHLIDAEFRKAWMPFFCRSGHLVVTPDQFLDFVGHLLPQEPYYSARNQFERFRGFVELLNRFEFEFCRCVNYFLKDSNFW